MTRLRAGFVLAVGLVTAVACGSPLTPVDRVILVTLDTTRADRVGCYGYEDAETPALDGLAAEGALFEQAVSPVPTTLASHATMFTGLYPHDHGVRYNMLYKLSQDAVTLAEALQSSGFATAAFPATKIVSERFGLGQGFDTWIEPSVAPEDDDYEHPLATMRRAGEGVDQALEWIGEHADQRLFVWLHFYDAHWPYTPPFPYASRYRDRPYDGEIAYADAQLGRLLEALRADPGWGRTLVVVAGDHGEGLYDHGERYHSTLIYETTQRVPLVVRAPGGIHGRIAEPVTLADLTPTILDLTDTPFDRPMRGISLRPGLEGRKLPRRDIYFETLTGSIAYGWAELYGVRYGPLKLIHSSQPELFDLVDDAAENRNLAEEEPALLAELESALHALSEPLGAGGAEDAVVQQDPETLAMLASLGYVAAGTGAATGSDRAHPKDLIDLEPEILAAQTALAQGDHERVETVGSYVLGRDPTNTWALAAVAGARLASGEPEAALEPALKMTEVVPGSETGWVLVARCRRDLGDELGTLEALNRGLELSPGSEQLAYLRLVASFEAGREDACAAPLDDARERHPDSSRIAIMEARCSARAGDLEAAMASMRAAVGHGFRSFKALGEAPELAPILDTPEYHALLAETESKDALAEAESGSGRGRRGG